MKKRFIVLAAVLAIFIALHSTPKTAIRTKVFMMGHPIIAFTTGIVVYEFYVEKEKERIAKRGDKVFSLTNPPIERGTEGILDNYRVSKVGFLYFAKYWSGI